MREPPRGNALRVVIDARVWDGASGGVQQWIIGLASAFSALEANGDEYLFLVRPGGGGWLEPFVSGPSRLVTTGQAEDRPSSLRTLRSELGRRLPQARRLWRRVVEARARPVAVPISDGTVERLEADVVHFPFQDAFTTELPSIYQPWDLQHIHLPEFFSARERARREVTYRAFSERAAAIVTATRWVKRDLMAQYGVPLERVTVVNVPPVTTAYPALTPDVLAAASARLGLPEHFLFYPAQTWPHKNHATLFAALGRLRADGLRIPLVCSGQTNLHHPEAVRAAREAGIEDEVRFVGFVPPQDVEVLYRSATALVFPSLYEGWGLPILEAFQAGLPVACSDVTSLPELVGDAALVFDPRDPDAIAAAIHRLWTSPALARELGERGRTRAAQFSWRQAALTLRALYRDVSGLALNEDDRALLDAEPLV